MHALEQVGLEGNWHHEAVPRSTMKLGLVYGDLIEASDNVQN